MPLLSHYVAAFLFGMEKTRRKNQVRAMLVQKNLCYAKDGVYPSGGPFVKSWLIYSRYLSSSFISSSMKRNAPVCKRDFVTWWKGYDIGCIITIRCKVCFLLSISIFD